MAQRRPFIRAAWHVCASRFSPQCAFVMVRTITTKHHGHFIQQFALAPISRGSKRFGTRISEIERPGDCCRELDERAYTEMIKFLRARGQPIPVSRLVAAYRAVPGLQAAVKRAGGAKRFVCSSNGKLRWAEDAKRAWCMLDDQVVPRSVRRHRQKAQRRRRGNHEESDGDDEDDDRYANPASMGIYFGPGGYVGEIGDGVMEEHSLFYGYR
mmetsp:Transcript_97438/g.297729  ORF Transcript_97438/g.297729 Transcript_97438/m.297729 type:complete len:212 (+) Transcript_97438:124-759(+)